MKTFFQFLLYLVIAVLVIVLGVILGAEASWYFAWLVGTVMIVLISAAGGALLDAQEDEKKRNPG
jgi:predicted outer membrane lipoprotein